MSSRSTPGCGIGFSASAGWFLFHQTVFFSWAMPELERNLALLLPLKPDIKTDLGDSLYLKERRNGKNSGEDWVASEDQRKWGKRCCGGWKTVCVDRGGADLLFWTRSCE